jgi:hypothetical protein
LTVGEIVEAAAVPAGSASILPMTRELGAWMVEDERFIVGAATLRVGDQLGSATGMGPMVDAAVIQRLMAWIGESVVASSRRASTRTISAIAGAHSSGSKGRVIIHDIPSCPRRQPAERRREGVRPRPGALSEDGEPAVTLSVSAAGSRPEPATDGMRG